MVKFVDALPPKSPAGGSGRPFSYNIEELRARSGEWAEIKRYPVKKRNAAQSQSNRMRRRHEDIETTVRTIGNQVILFARAV